MGGGLCQVVATEMEETEEKVILVRHIKIDIFESMSKDVQKKGYRRYHAYPFRGDRNVFSWESLAKMAKKNGNSINEEINYAIHERLMRQDRKTKM